VLTGIQFVALVDNETNDYVYAYEINN